MRLKLFLPLLFAEKTTMKKNQHGLALIQVLIAAGITSVLALAIVQLMDSQSRSIIYLEDQLEKISLIRNVETILKDNITCQSSLQGLKVDKLSVPLADLKDPSGNTVFTSNSVEGNIRLGQMRLTSTALIGPEASGLVEIVVPMSRTRVVGGPQHFKSYNTKVIISTDANELVVGCASPSNAIFKTTCASGYTFMGTPGEQDSFCISTNRQPKSTFLEAVSSCYNRTPKARLCTASEWLMACVSGKPNNMTGAHERVADYGDNHYSKVVGLTNCSYSTDSYSFETPSGKFNYRCCYK